jgi:ribose 5-phosphate isomerase B
VLALGARVVDESTAIKLVDKFVDTQFAGGRHQLRVNKMMAIEQESSK